MVFYMQMVKKNCKKMLKNVKKSRKMAKKNWTTFEQNEYDIRNQRPKKHIIPLENSMDLKRPTKRPLASGVL